MPFGVRCAIRGRLVDTGGFKMEREGLDDKGTVQVKIDKKTGRVYRYPVADGKVPEDWWTDIETLNHSDRERVGWPSQKPERLIERLLAAVTQPGDRVVMDPAELGKSLEDWYGLPGDPF